AGHSIALAIMSCRFLPWSVGFHWYREFHRGNFRSPPAVSANMHPRLRGAGITAILAPHVQERRGAMKRWQKITLGVAAVLLVVGIVLGTIHYSGRNVVTVQTAKSQRQDLTSVVTASGEIKPKTYVNVGANAFGKITHLYVKEGDRVKRGQLLAQLENVQSSADVSATQAGLEAAGTDALAAEAGYKTAMADLNRAKADHDRTKLDWQRAQSLYKEALIAKSEYEARQNAWLSADAGLAQAEARVAQAKAQLDSAQRRVSQTRANLTRVSDV